MKGWVGLVGWPVADGLPTLVVTHQLQVERMTGKVRRPETNVLPLCHDTNLAMHVRWAIRAQLPPRFSFLSHATPQSPIYWTAKNARVRSPARVTDTQTHSHWPSFQSLHAGVTTRTHARTLALRPAFTTRPLPRFPRNYWSRMRCRKTGPFNFPAVNSYILTIHESVRQIQLYTSNHTKLQKYWQLLPPTE